MPKQLRAFRFLFVVYGATAVVAVWELSHREEDEVKRLALEDEKIRGLVEGMEVKRVVVVPNRLVNVVVAPRVAAEQPQE